MIPSTSCIKLEINDIWSSNKPKVFGWVSIIPATSSFILLFKSSISTRPLLSVPSSTGVYPASITLAGFVPCALSGIKTIFLFKLLCVSWYLRINNNPTNSPCEPADGCKVNADIPVIFFNICSNS